MSKLGVTLDILNQKGTPAFYSDIFTNRPAAGFAGRVFISTDTGAIYEDTGSTWTLIADAGAGTTGTLQQVTTNGNTTTQGISITAGGLSSNQVSIVGGTASQFLKANGTLDSSTYLTTGSAASTYLPLAGGTLTGNLSIPSNQLAIGTATPGAPLDIHTTTGTAAQFNGTTTNNAFVFFQNAGTSKWRIGNLYNAGANSFQVYDNASATARLTILNSGATTINGALTSTSVAITGGTSAQFLKADGTTDSNTYLTTSSASSTYLPLAGGTLTGALSGTSITGTSLVKSGGTSAQILAADGSVITAGTNITISGGTISASGGGGSMAIGGSITSATAGSVLYAGASGVLAQSNANFYYDYTNARLGIGTNAPSVDIHVIKSATAKIGIGVNGTANIATYFAQNITDGHYLEVNCYGTTSASTIYGVSSNGCTAFNMLPKTTGYGIIGNQTAAPLLFGTTNLERMRIFAGGNVIIGGTTDAGYKLDVSGTFRTTGAATFGSTLGVTGNSTIGGTLGIGSTTPSTPGSSWNYMQIGGRGGLFAHTSVGATFLAENAYPSTSSNLYITTGVAAGYQMSNGMHYWYNAPSGSANSAITFTTAMQLFTTGNLAIGSTTDNGQGVLQVTGGITANDISLTGATYAATATITKNYYSLFTGSTGQTLTLPSPSSNNYQYVIINTTANSVTIAAATSTNIINTTNTSVASITLIANARCFIIADGNNKYYQVY